MNFRAGDQVVHSSYGLGVILKLDEKKLQGRTGSYYVVQIRDMTLWVPAGDNGESSLRYPTPADDFDKLFAILTGPAETLSDDRLARKTELSDRLKDGKLDSFCRAIRDLTHRRRSKAKMNDNDTAVLERSLNFLLAEWSVSRSVTASQARLELRDLLGEELPRAR